MGAKTWMLVCSDSPARDVLNNKPTLDRARTTQLAQQLFPNEILAPIEDASLEYTSRPESSWLQTCSGKYAYLHAMHSVVDWFAYATWENNNLKRALSLSPDSGVIEDVGRKLSFEEPYWAGEYPFVFHPLELGEAALSSFFGYILEGFPQPEHIEPSEITLLAFQRKKKRWWKIW